MRLCQICECDHEQTGPCPESQELDPRDPDPSREGIFRNHNCAYCDSGKQPCRQGDPNRCDNPHARND